MTRASRPLLVAAVLAVLAPSIVTAQSAGSGQVELDGVFLPEGVTPVIHRSVERGLEYLASNRQRDRARGHTFWAKSNEGHERDRNVYRCAITALAGLAFLAHGDTPTRGKYAEIVDEVTEFLLWCGENDQYGQPGLITTTWDEEERPMYSHGLTLTFLGQVFGQDGDLARRERIRKVLVRGVEVLARSQTNDGGWGYVPNHDEDEGTLTVVQLQGLRVCRDAGIAVPKSVIDRAVDFIRKSTNPDGSVRYRVRSNRVRHGVTCAAVVALWNAGDYDSTLFKRIVSYVNSDVMAYWRDFNSWYRYHHGEFICYYLAQAQWVQGGRQWDAFYPHLASSLLRVQSPEGHWEGKDRGENYGTAIALLTLQLPYNRLPVYQR